MEQLDIFTYPIAAGFKAEGTSREAAEKITPKVTGLRARVLEVLKRGAYTADEVAAILGMDKGDVRPRCSELVNLNQIYDTGIRRPSSRGTPSSVWRAL